MDIIFLTKDEILDLHALALDTHGGSTGLRDEGGLESAIASPEFRHYYENADIFECAAAYAYHLSQAHAFVDGNKRVAFAASIIFLEVNGIEVDVEDGAFIGLFLDIAAGKLTREDVEAFLHRLLEQS